MGLELRSYIPARPDSKVRLSLCGLKGLVPSVQQAITYLGSRAAVLPSPQLAPEHRQSMLRAAGKESEATSLELAGFGVSHDALGAALCKCRGLGQAAVASVCHHVQTQATGSLPEALVKRPICALSVMVAATKRAPDALDAVARAGLINTGFLAAALREALLAAEL